MKSARFLLLVMLLPLFIACVATAPTYVARPLTNLPDSLALAEAGKAFRITGYVLQAGSCKPVPGIAVRDKDSWHSARTDANGYFVLRLPNTLYQKNKQVVVETVFYEGSATTSADTAKPVTVLLRRNAYRPAPDGCRQRADTARIAPYVTMPIAGIPGTQYAFLILDSTARQPQKLRTIAFKVGGYDGLPPESARLRIYHYDNHIDAPPGEDRLLENFFMFPSKEGIFTYDVSTYDIIVSATGFFLAIEYYVGGIRGGYREPIIGYTPTGPILRPPCARADIRTWGYAIGKGWHRATAAENCWPLYESALSVEVEPAPSQPTKH